MALFNFDKIFRKSKKFQQMEKTLEELSQLEVFIGYNADSGSYEDGTTVLEIAVYNAFGTIRIPSRPFIQNVEFYKMDDIKAFMKQRIKIGLAKSEDARKIMNEIGVYVKGLIQEEILVGGWVPNAPSTIKKKGSSQPLIDTGRLRQSIVYVVRKRGSA